MHRKLMFPEFQVSHPYGVTDQVWHHYNYL